MILNYLQKVNGEQWGHKWCPIGGQHVTEGQAKLFQIFSGKGKKLIEFRVTTHALLDEIVPASAPPPLAVLWWERIIL